MRAVCCIATALAVALSCTSCSDGRVETVESELESMRTQVQQLQAQLVDQASRQQRSEAEMVEWLDATSRQLDRFLDRIGAPPLEGVPDEGSVGAVGGVAQVPVEPAPAEAATQPAVGIAPVDIPRPVAVGPTAWLLSLALLAACAGIGFVALRTLRRDADPTASVPVAAGGDEGHTKLLASLTEWDQSAQSASQAAPPEAEPAVAPAGEEEVPIAASRAEAEEFEGPAHHAGPAVVEPEAAPAKTEVPTATVVELSPAAEAPDATGSEVTSATPPPEPESRVALVPVPEVARRPQVVEHEVPGRIAVDPLVAPRAGVPEPIRLPGPPRARFRAMTESPEDAAVALAAILQIDPRVMRRPAPTVATTATTVVAEYSLVPALPPGERGELEARLWQAVGEARKHGSRPQPSV